MRLGGRLTLPEVATGIVVFAHGTGSSAHSPRNRYVAALLNQAGLGTLLFDLLTKDEEHDRANVFDIELLAGRPGDRHPVAARASWHRSASHRLLRRQYRCRALWAASEPGTDIAAVVARGGRPDLAALRLPLVAAPTLLIVGSDDDVVLDLNRQAQARLQRCENHLAVIPGATHLFEESGKLQAAAETARDWSTCFLLGNGADREHLATCQGRVSPCHRRSPTDGDDEPQFGSSRSP